ncbi:c-type cytochrome [Gemmata sp. G18]|uniref:C-type cytochrome n=1 Tax=Gemmata palustris TaxID=2822762 RepID=A0ABS5BKQ6_9BACT|nr:PVC-type heme-binding CxxCH protein [Gemmata palustris]MBP3954292.1 c-type cytochrome [Gemmata palustris]
MPRLISLAAFLAFAAPAFAQPKGGGPLPPEKALAALKIADGFQVELFAAEPMLINPTSIDVDHKGRVWVAEAVNYRRKNFGRPIIRKEGDRIVVLVDANGGGKATEAKTFYQGEELYGPLGVCVAPYADGKGQRVFVCQSPDILVFEDKDGDLKADGPPKKFLTGFGGFDHDHGVHGLNIGPDGKLYFTVGDGGLTGLQASDGKGKKWVTNTTDCQKGTVWRCDADGTNLELIAHNFRNNYECCVNSFGEVWLSDNDDDGNQQTRICFVMPGGNYGYGPRGPGQSHWHEEQPGIVHKTLRVGQGSPTGITFYEGALFPKKYQGALLHCDCAPAEVRWFFPKAKGAGYELTKELLLSSSDPWFRPSDVCVAPDGSIFVADWYDRGVGGHGMGDPTDGRIYRITPKGHTGYKVPEVKLDTSEEIATALCSPNLAVRATTFAKLRNMPQLQVNTILSSAMLNSNSNSTLYLIAGKHLRGIVEVEDVAKEMNLKADDFLKKLTGIGEGFIKSSATFRAGDTRTIPFAAGKYAAPGTVDFEDRVREMLVAMAGQEENQGWKSPAVYRECLIQLRFLKPNEKVVTFFYTLAESYDGQDHFYRAALNIACGTDPNRRDAILADFDKHFPEWNDKVADLVWELRPKSVLPRLGKLLADPKLTAAQKARVVDILATSDELAAGVTMLDVLKSDAAPEMKARAIESLKLFLPTKWKTLQTGKELASALDALLANEKTTATGLQLIAAANAVDRVDAVAAIAKNKDAAFDLRKEAVRTLGKLPDDKSVSALIEAGSPENPLSVACIQALGELLPKGQKAPKYATVALDSLVRGINAGDRGTPELKSACLTTLAGNRAGTTWLLDAHAKGDLPKELLAEAGRLLRNSPYADLANRAKLAFPAPGKLNPKSLPAVAELARRAGDVARGKAVWNATLTGAAQCAKCHMVRGIGGQVGPDLSMIGKKVSRENLYESLLTPSKAIADQYIQHSVTTNADVTVSGLLVSDTPTAITLRDANGKDTTVLKKDVEGQVRKLKTSIMPDDIIAALNEDELVDLVAYLETLKTAALTPDSFQIVGPFPAKNMDEALDAEYGPEKSEFDAKAVFRLQLPKTIGEAVTGEWKTIRPDGKGYFDLAAYHGNRSTNSASYMHVEIESPSDQAAEILLGPDDGARLWVNGKDVFSSRESKAAAPESQKVSVKLVKGKNTVLLKVANGNNPHGFYFSLTSAEETKVVPRK